ncbi:carbohydrate-binding module family 1 protein [Melanomma pulvis-pyrius CBS 109.77]|uniref:AA9 family lytic polysaccharide monooxygenase n=1 Tax=Melanomma pulvis-pyrius CBS 109.77 TaxID=1314802 RepID=A0A6A6XHY1_9PLEO|nr:carbohydrate-binding module family 1 protein [Melanomma pulvis-pyrius CBS 109.77]
MFQSLVALSFIAAASAHQNLHQVWVNDVSPGYQVGLRMPPSNSPVTDVTSNDMACNVGGSTVPSGVETIAASEGDSITVGWDTSGHPGPITHFLFGPVDDAAQESGIGAGWFKIDEVDYVDGKWANEVMLANGGNHTFSLPAGLATGEYLLRSEMLALHGAQTIGGGQFYIGCAQLKITGTGSGSCGPTIAIPGAYKAEDSNIYIPNVYNGFDPTNYTAPGGPLASCGGAGTVPAVSSKAPVASASSTAAPIASVIPAGNSSEIPVPTVTLTTRPAPIPTLVVPTTLATITAPGSVIAVPSLSPSNSVNVTVSAPTPTGTGTVGTVALYGQCGGLNYSGSKQCGQGATCQKQNDYYYQCVSGQAFRRRARA